MILVTYLTRATAHFDSCSQEDLIEMFTKLTCTVFKFTHKMLYFYVNIWISIFAIRVAQCAGFWDWRSTRAKDLKLRFSTIAKTPNIRCFVAKSHLSRFACFFQTTNVCFLLCQGGGGVSPKADIVCFFFSNFSREAYIYISTCRAQCSRRL